MRRDIPFFALMLCGLWGGLYNMAWSQATALVTLDGDLTDAKATEIWEARVGQVVQIEVFGEDVKGAIGYRVTLAHDPAQLRFAGFTVTDIIPGLSGLAVQDSTKGTVEVGGGAVEGASAVAKGRLGIVRFEVLAGFSGRADVTLKSASVIRPDGRTDSDVTSTVSVIAGLASDFNGDGTVDFDDFFAFAAAFGTKQGQPGFNAKFDLSKNGEVDFDDFFIFAGDFGKTTK